MNHSQARAKEFGVESRYLEFGVFPILESHSMVMINYMEEMSQGDLQTRDRVWISQIQSSAILE